MSPKTDLHFLLRNGSSRVAAVDLSKLFLAILLMSGLLHATPISGWGAWRMQAQKTSRNSEATSSSSKGIPALMAIDLALKPNLNGGISMKPSAAACALSGGCSSPVEVPEPQALVLVGTGALSMAGVIRRRLSR
jgi:hypothetical protein